MIVEEFNMINKAIKEALSYEIADEFVTYSEAEEIYVLCLELQIEKSTENENTFIDSLTYPEDEISKEIENAIEEITSLIADKIVTLSDDDFLTFAINNYDEDFNYKEEAINLNLISA